MTKPNANAEQPAIKDEEVGHPVASKWRPALHDVAAALAAGDYRRQIPSVTQLAEAKANDIRRYVAQYGETLVELPSETWSSSVALWMGSHWEVHVDLWTAESGCSDLVLHGRVFEEDGGAFRIEIDSVHVP